MRSNTGQGPFAVDGLNIEVTAGANIGDSFLIRPGYRAASFFKVEITEPGKIAAAAPLVASAPITNQGDAKINSIENANMTGLPVGDDVSLTYSASAWAGQPGFTLTRWRNRDHSL